MGRLTNTVGGNIASFKSCAGADIKSLKCYFSPVQEGSGDPSPSNVRTISGWNNVLISYCNKNLLDESIRIDTAGFIQSFGGTPTGVTNGDLILPPGTYTFSTDGPAATITVYNKAKAYITIQHTVTSVTFTLSEITEIGIIYQHQDVTYHYQLEVGSTATAYVPHTISKIPITFPSIGKNKINMAQLSNYEGVTYNNNTIISTAGNLHNIMREKENRFKIYIPANTHFSFSCNAYTEGNETTTGQGLAVVAKYANKTSSRILFIASNSATSSIQFQFSSTLDDPIESLRFYCYTGQNNIWHISNMQLELGDTITEYEPYSSNNTVYGGYVDLITGALVKTHHKIIFTGDEIGYSYSDKSENNISPLTKVQYFTGSSSYIDIQPVKKASEQNITQAVYSHGAYTLDNSSTYHGCAVANTDQTAFFVLLFLQCEADPTSIKNYLATQYSNGTPVEICYELAIPTIVGYLSPIQLKTLMGQNNIWSNTNNTVEVEYDLHETKDIVDAKKRVLLAQPHLATASGSIAHFNTNTSLSLKQATIEFLPVQYGSGDPTPNNIRSITGWTGIQINHSGKNMLKCDGVSNGTAGGITYTKHTNENNIVDYITCNGTTDTLNAFRNLNYSTNVNKIPRGTISTNSFSDQANIVLIRPDNISDNNVRFYTSDDGAGTAASRTGWFNYNTDKFDEYMSWARIQIWPNVKNTEIDTIVYPMMCHQDDRGCEYEPYYGTTTTIPWENDYGTIYGGYIDLINGKIIKEWEKISLKNQDWYNYSAFQWFAIDLNKDKYTDVYCNCFPVVDATLSSSLRPNECVNSYHNGASYADKLYFWKTDGNFISANDFRDWINGLEYDPYVVYKLATPIEYTLTPQQISAFKGTNNFWSNTNGDLTIKYWTH